MASYFPALAADVLQGATGSSPVLRRTARNCIFVFLAGGPSHVDTFDFKDGPWVPGDFDPTTYGGIRWPRGLMPQIAQHLDRIAIVRSGLAWAAVHPLAQKWVQISRNAGDPTARTAPHIGAVVSLESQRLRPDAVLPGFIALGTTMAAAGYLPAEHAPFALPVTAGGLPAIAHADGPERARERWRLLLEMDGWRGSATPGGDVADMAHFYERATLMAETPRVNDLFILDGVDVQRYGATAFGQSLLIARNLVAANLGTRFVQVTLDGWDHHDYIYAPSAPRSLYRQGRTLDDALGPLLTDLSSTPGAVAGKTLLDETLVVVLGEFGRTVGAPTGSGESGGRDHYPRMSILFAGGGVRGGRAIGVTDDRGDRVKEYGWRANRDVRPEDVTATIYSALGIDYTTVRTDDPSGRGFEYVPYANAGLYGPVDEVFG